MTQLNFDTHCEMNFRFYPFDKQVGYLPHWARLKRDPKKLKSGHKKV